MSQRILVVDDDKEIVRIIRAYLQQAGYAVLTAYDGAPVSRGLDAATGLQLWQVGEIV